MTLSRVCWHKNQFQLVENIFNWHIYLNKAKSEIFTSTEKFRSLTFITGKVTHQSVKQVKASWVTFGIKYPGPAAICTNQNCLAGNLP